MTKKPHCNICNICGLEADDRPTDATYAKKADGRTWQCQPSQILHLKVVFEIY